jgi:spore coat protein JB
MESNHSKNPYNPYTNYYGEIESNKNLPIKPIPYKEPTEYMDMIPQIRSIPHPNADNTIPYTSNENQNPYEINATRRDELLLQLTALDFMAVDLHLYLDTHPNDKEALTKYNAIIAKADTLRNTYQQKYGPLYSFRSPSRYPWEWTDGSWPTLREFNFELPGKEC